MNVYTTRCKFLRAKNAYGTTEGGDHPFLPIESGTTTYWCLKTCSPCGPDNQPAYTGVCGARRVCFQAMQPAEGEEVA